jgi:hypothetical protein
MGKRSYSSCSVLPCLLSFPFFFCPVTDCVLLYSSFFPSIHLPVTSPTSLREIFCTYCTLAECDCSLSLSLFSLSQLKKHFLQDRPAIISSILSYFHSFKRCYAAGKGPEGWAQMLHKSYTQFLQALIRNGHNKKVFYKLCIKLI